MKAMLYHEYGAGQVLRYEDIDKPAAADGEVLVKVRAAALNPLDWHFMRGKPYLFRLAAGLRKPKAPRLGIDAAGQVEAVGKGVAQFKQGDEVFGAVRGAFAQYACASESTLARKPGNVSFEEAAAVPVAALTALQGLRDKGRLAPAQKVLINGASGGVGTFAVQLARHFGAHVTGVCSARNVELVRSLGADRVIDYTRESFVAGGGRYDLILDCIGNQPLSACRSVLDPKGSYVVVGGPDGWWIGPLARLLQALALSPFVSQRLVAFVAKANREDLTTLQGLLYAGKVRPVIDRRYRLRELAQAIGYLEQGHARGKVVVTVEHDGRA